MINQFRRKYPQGTLISELVSSKHGKYIVKVTIESEGKILATALAGDYTVELAEDRARERALAILDLSVPSSPVTPVATTTPVSVNNSTPIATSSPVENTPIVALKVETSPTPPSPPTPTPTEDFVSDIIAEIGIQIERLGWTKEQGKEYLLKTYGKKSRHLLSDQELLEFLDYLKSQPS